MRRMALRFLPATGRDRRLLPWPAAFVLAVVSFALLQWGAPELLRGSSGMVFIPIVQALAIVVGAIFCVLGVLGFIAARNEQLNEYTPPPDTEPPVVPKRVEPVPDPTSTSNKRVLDAIEWDKTLVVPHPTAVKPTAWARDVIERMEWRRFELVVDAFFKLRGYRTEVISRAPDGGVDAKLVRAADKALIGLMHAQPGAAPAIGADQLRGLIGAMAQARSGRAVYVTAGHFDDEAMEFAKGQPIQLLNGDMLLAKILQLPADKRDALLATATEGDWTTPTCPACAAKMVRRAGGGLDFWACANMPQCTATMQVVRA